MTKLRGLLAVAAFLLLLGGAFAYDLDSCIGNGDWNAIGTCILRGSFGADPMFFAVIMLIIMTIFMYQTNLPVGASIGIALLTFFAMAPFFAVGIYQVLINLMILVVGILVGKAILKYVGR